MTHTETISGWLRQVDLDSKSGRIRCQAGSPDVSVFFDDTIAASALREAFMSRAELVGQWKNMPPANVSPGGLAEYRSVFVVDDVRALK